MAIVLIIVTGFVLFVFGGLLGWVLKAVGYIFDFLWEGCTNSLSCLVIIVLALLFLIALI